MMTSATHYQDGSVRRQPGADVRSNTIQVKGQGSRTPGLTRQEGVSQGFLPAFLDTRTGAVYAVMLCEQPSRPGARPRGVPPCPGTAPNAFAWQRRLSPWWRVRTPRAVLYPPAGRARNAERSMRSRFTAPSHL
jgi:hypothetical protein